MHRCQYGMQLNAYTVCEARGESRQAQEAACLKCAVESCKSPLALADSESWFRILWGCWWISGHT